ncbi:MAG: urate hydroxylase PuuD, partial [Pararhodobacter sp.]
TEYTWVIASLVFLMGVTIRHWFNSLHARTGKPAWTWAITVMIFIVIMWLSVAPALRDEEDVAALPPSVARFAMAGDFDAVHSVVMGRCSMCHAEQPVYPGLNWAPRGVLLETEAQVARAARQVYLQSGRAHAMPPANVTWMDDEERALIRRWYQGVAGAAG